MEGLLIVIEGGDSNAVDAPFYILKNKKAAESYFEPWYEDELHTGVSENGTVFRIARDHTHGRTSLCAIEATEAARQLFFDRMKIALEHGLKSRQSAMRNAARRAIALLEREPASAYRFVEESPRLFDVIE